MKRYFLVSMACYSAQLGRQEKMCSFITTDGQYIMKATVEHEVKKASIKIDHVQIQMISIMNIIELSEKEFNEFYTPASEALSGLQ